LIKDTALPEANDFRLRLRTLGLEFAGRPDNQVRRIDAWCCCGSPDDVYEFENLVLGV